MLPRLMPKKRFMPVNNDSGAFAVQSTDYFPHRQSFYQPNKFP